MAEHQGNMALNISLGDTPQPRPQPSPRSPFARTKPPFQNDLNAPTRADSIDDNTKVPGYNNNSPTSSNVPTNRCRRTKKRRNRRYTLSIIEKELEEAKRLIEAKLDPSQHAYNISTDKHDTGKSSNLKDNLDIRSSETEPKTPYIPSSADRPRSASRSEKVYARYVQEGDRNLMLIYEPKETKSEIYYKQIGNKNVIVHLNISSNLCQLIDPVNKGIIPLDSEGEVWLEIKRRSQLLGNGDDISDVTSDSVFENCKVYSGVRQGNEYVTNISRNDSYVEGKIGQCEATENSDIGDRIDENDYVFDAADDDEEPYNTISIKERGDSLMIKFEKWNQHGVLNSESLKDSPILSHEKVIDFLRNKGNDFDVSICDWEYEKEESVYSYISSNLALVEINEDYTEIPPDVQQQRRPRVKEPEEREASTFGQPGEPCYDTPIEHKPDECETEAEIYSRINKPRAGDIQGHTSDSFLRPGNRTHHEKEIHRSVSDPAKRRPSPVENVDHSQQKLATRTSDPEKYLKKPGVPVRPPKLPPKPADLSQHKWYHGKIEKYVAKERLKGKEHGSFLVRDSAKGSDSAHQYTIEFIDGSAVKKLMIMKTQDKYHFKEYKDKKFDRVEYLIHTIMTNGLEVKDSTCDRWKNIKVKPVQHS